MVKTKKHPACPICQKPVVPKFRPFCSERCKLIDLHRWLKGTYVIPGTEAPSETETNQTTGDAEEQNE